MLTNNDILNMKPTLIKEKIIYCREEKGGYFSYRFNTPALENEIIVNSVCVTIINMCNGINSVNDIVNYIVNKYNVDREKILKDVLHTLNQFTVFQLIKWDNNPFKRKIKQKISNNYSINLIDFIRINECIDFFKLDTTQFDYINPYLDDRFIYDSNLLNTGELTKSQYIYTLEEENKLLGVLICAINPKSTVTSVLAVAFDSNVDSNIKKIFFDTAIETTTTISEKRITKYRVYLIEGENFPNTPLPFRKEIVLNDELGFGINLEEYNYNLYD